MLPLLMWTLLSKRIKIQGFIISDHNARFPAFAAEMGPWIAEGRVKYHEDRVDSLEAAPEALLGLLQGRNFGKVVVSVGPV
jgi:NADPH-dependent curcumin reductase CurA